MMGLSIDALFAGIIPFFFICFGLIWVAFKIIDFLKK